MNPLPRGRSGPPGAGLRSPKSARPSRSRVAPSSTATGKSSLIPIQRWGSSTPSRPRDVVTERPKPAKTGPGVLGGPSGPIVMRPRR
jgi:hypothetical protein